MKKLFFSIILLLFCSKAFAYSFTFNPHTGRLDAVGVGASSDIVVACDNNAIWKYSTATNTWGCGTDSTGVGGGTAALEDYLIDVSAGGGVSVDTTEVSHDQTFGSGTLGETKWNQRLSGGVTSLTWKTGRTNISGDWSASGDMYVLGDDIFMSNGSNLRASVDVVVAKSHDAVTLAGENYLSLSGQQITAGKVSGDHVATQGVSTDKFEAVNKPSDGYLMRYNATALKGEWVPCSTITGSAGLCDGNDASGGGGSSAVEDYLIDISAGSGVSVDITEVSKDMTFSDGTLSAIKQNFRLNGGTQSLTIRPSNWDFSNNLNVSGDLTITGDDLFMGTNTAGFILIGDNTNYNPVDFSGDGDLSSSGVFTIGTAAVSGDKVATQGVSTDKLEASNKPQDGYLYRYNGISLKGQWVPCSTVTGSAGLCDGSDDGGVGSSGRDTNAQREFIWPASALLPIQASADSIAPIVKDAGTNVDYLVRAYDSAATECAGGTFQVPWNADTSKSVTIRRKYYASTAHATANRVVESFKHLARENSEALDASFNEVSFDAVAVDSTQDDLTVASKDLTFASLGWVSSDMVTFEHCRKGNALGDDLGSDLYMIELEIEIPRSGQGAN